MARTRRPWWRVALVVMWAAVGAAGCKHFPSEKELQGAQIHYDLGVQQQQSGNVQGALASFQKALELDPNFAEAHNGMGVLLHLSFQRPAEAVVHYQRALEIRPDFSEAKTNLANVYLDQGRYDEAIALYHQALNDMLYPTPYIAQGNLGWALYKRSQGKGEDVQRAVDSIKASVTTNPKFCLGFKNLGIIYTEQGNTAEACKSFGKYREACPETPDAYYQEGICLARNKDNEGAKKAFAGCQTKAGVGPLQQDCKRLLDALQSP